MSTDLVYCPACAGKLVLRPVGNPPSEHPTCDECGFVLWRNPKPSVGALIVRGAPPNAELLLGRRAAEPGKGKWDVPGGFLNLGDDPEGALVRECLREVGMTIKVGQLVAAISEGSFGDEVALFYQCELESGQPRPADIVDEVAWYRVAEPPDIAFESVRLAVERLRIMIG